MQLLSSQQKSSIHVWSTQTQCASRPCCEMVTMILSLKFMTITSVLTPSTRPAVCFVAAGNGKSKFSDCCKALSKVAMFYVVVVEHLPFAPHLLMSPGGQGVPTIKDWQNVTASVMSDIFFLRSTRQQDNSSLLVFLPSVTWRDLSRCLNLSRVNGSRSTDVKNPLRRSTPMQRS